MFSPEWILILPFLVVSVTWLLIDDEEFQKKFDEMRGKNDE